MATKKKIDPTAAALTILGIAAVSFGVWQFIIKPKREKKNQQINDLIASYPSEVLDAQFEQIDEQTA
jgi:hypothetical protein